MYDSASYTYRQKAKRLKAKQKVIQNSLGRVSFFGNQPLHRGAICQFTFPWIYYYGSNKSTGKETGKTHKMLVLFLLPIVKPKTHSLSTNVLWLKNKGYKCYWEFIRVNAFSYKYNTTLLGIFEYKSNIFFGKHYILWFQKRLILFPRKYVCDPIRSSWLVVLLTFRQKS